MASAQAVRAGKAFVELGVDDKITAGLNKAAAKFKAFGATIAASGARIAALGSGITAPFLAAAKVFDSMGSALHDASQRTGVAVESLSALKFAAEQSGGSLDEVEAGLRKMSKVISGVSEGNKSAADTLSDLGLSFAQLRNLNPEEQFNLIGDALSKVQDATKRASLAQEVFGKGGVALLPTLSEGAAGLAAMRKQAEDLGLIMSTEDATAADAFGDALGQVFAQLKMITFQAGAAVGKALLPYAKTTGVILKAVIDWTKAHAGLIVGITLVGAALVALGSVVTGLGVTLFAVGTAIAGIAAAFTFLVSPLGLALAAAAALVVVLLKFTPIGSIIAAGFRELGRIFGETFQGINDAIAGGNLELASKIMFAGLKVVWAEGIIELQAMWLKLFEWLNQALGSLSPFPSSITEEAVADFIKARDELARLRKEAEKLRGNAPGHRPPSPGELGDTIAGAQQKISAVGIFNKAAILSLQSSPTQTRMEKHLANIEKNTRKPPGLAP